jgi:hypothetical protein
MPRQIPFPSVDELSRAPQRAALTLLEASADLTVLALAAAYPELHDAGRGEQPHELRAVLDVIDGARELAAAINRYQIALLRVEKTEQALPF